jgi:hypothetical protein
MSNDLIFPVPESVSCEVCAKAVPRSAALQAESRDGIAYFCGTDCYDNWSRVRAPERGPHEVQAGQGHRKSRDERMKRLVKQHPLRDEPRVDSVEPDEVPQR